MDCSYKGPWHQPWDGCGALPAGFISLLSVAEDLCTLSSTTTLPWCSSSSQGGVRVGKLTFLGCF